MPGIRWLFKPKPVLLTADVCLTVTNHLSDHEGIPLEYGLDRHDGAWEYRTRSQDTKTCWGMYVKGRDLVITDALVREDSDALFARIFSALEYAARNAPKVDRIIVQDTHSHVLSMYLLRNGYSPGLQGDDYRKLIRKDCA